jgi:PIN domain nuclease of toxin-antitoxin system
VSEDYLLDTHVLLWYLAGDERLSSAAKGIVSNPKNVLYMSIASFWEVAIKMSLGKLSVEGGFDAVSEQADALGVHVEPLDMASVEKIVSLPPHHRDPFDRVIIATALCRNWPVVTADASYSDYPIRAVF